MQEQTWGRWVTALSAVGAGIMLAGGCGDDKPGPASTLTMGGTGGTGGAIGGTGGSGGTAGTSGTGGTGGAIGGGGTGGAIGGGGTGGAIGGGGTGGAIGGGGTGGAIGGGGAGGAIGGGGAGGGLDHCNSQAQDGDETDVDCGGSTCPPCAVNQGCIDGEDCQTHSCVGNLCAVATCNDQAQNGSETDEDCGGPTCNPCADGLDCLVDSDCESEVCELLTCQAPSCADLVQNGEETDIDCGGSTCGECGIGKGCQDDDDCLGDNCVSNVCSCPSGMGIVPVLGGGAYCIDRYEVTYLDYEAFWIANPIPSNQIAECQWNADYTPQVGWPEPNKGLPVVGVNWCEAYAYCRWRDKRLCGDIAADQPSPFADYANPNVSQWFNGCSAQGNNTFPYGDSYNPSTCNGLDHGHGTTIEPTCSPPPPPPGCVLCPGGAPDLRHMSGNVREWEASCDGSVGATDSCRTRGGSYLSGEQALRCDADDIATREDYAVDLGFRCCL